MRILTKISWIFTKAGTKNIPQKMFYSAEILQICKANKQDHIKSAIALIGRIIKEGSLINHMKKDILNLFNPNLGGGIFTPPAGIFLNNPNSVKVVTCRVTYYFE